MPRPLDSSFGERALLAAGATQTRRAGGRQARVERSPRFSRCRVCMHTGPGSLLSIAFTLTSFAGSRSLRVHPLQVSRAPDAFASKDLLDLLV